MGVVGARASAHGTLEPFATLADSALGFGRLDRARAGFWKLGSDAKGVVHARFARMIKASAGIGVTVIVVDALMGQSYSVPELYSRPTPTAQRGGRTGVRVSENGRSLHSWVSSEFSTKSTTSPPPPLQKSASGVG